MSLEGIDIGRYHIMRLLGSGGMGDVYLAEDARIEQQVAIKVIRTDISSYDKRNDTQEMGRLIQREAKAIVKLDHPNILPLFDYGEAHINTLTFIFLVMPYRPEGSLADMLRKRGSSGLLSPSDVLFLVRQVADALQHAHDHQIIHQDVKPSNLLMRDHKNTPNRPDLLLADFGIAKLASTTSSLSKAVRGTPTYMAPEQWDGEPVFATDQYALAVTTYELLTGSPPFLGPPARMMYQHINVPPAPPSSLNPHLSTEINTVLLQALEKKPENRFLTITAYSNAFEKAVQYQPILHNPVAMPPSSTYHIRAALAITSTEAIAGATRSITLPGGQKVLVTVPPGIQDGHIIRMEGEGEPSNEGHARGDLIFTIIIKQIDESLPLTNLVHDEQTALLATNDTLVTEHSDSRLANGNSDFAAFSSTLSPLPSIQPTILLESTGTGIVPDAHGPITPLPPCLEEDRSEVEPLKRFDALPTQRSAEAPEQDALTHNFLKQSRVEASHSTNGTGLLVTNNGRVRTPRTKPQRRFVVGALSLLVVLALGAGTAFAWPNFVPSIAKTVFGPHSTPSVVSTPSPSASQTIPVPAGSTAISITPASTTLKQTFTIAAVTGNVDSSKQVTAQYVSATTQTFSLTRNATGVKNVPAMQARGTLSFYSPSSSITPIPAGSMFKDISSGIQIATNTSFNISIQDSPLNVSAHTIKAGPIGNRNYSFYSFGPGITITDPSPFAGGSDAQNYTFVQQSDIYSAKSSLISSYTPNAQQFLQSHVAANQHFVGSQQCQPSPSSNHAPGDQASTVTVTVYFTCTGEVYDMNGARMLATKLLMTQATSNPGSAYSLVGNMMTAILQATPTQGGASITVQAEGVWVYQFNLTQKQLLAQLIEGMQQQDALNLLQKQAGVKQASIHSTGGDTSTLPADASHIIIVIQSVPGLQS